MLAHSYVPEDVFPVADATGDSLELCRYAQQTGASLIIFAGVYFMAESAALLNPDKKVILPNLASRCSLMDGYATAERRYPGIAAPDVQRLRDQHPGAPVMCYINTTAEVKAASDVCCTSANDVAIARDLIQEQGKIIYIPDANMAQNLRETLRDEGRDGEVISWEGRCEVHDRLTEETIIALRQAYPESLVVAHKECNAEVRDSADFVGGTGQMRKYIQGSLNHDFIVVTECGTTSLFQRQFPNKRLLGNCVECRYMHLNTLSAIADALVREGPIIRIADALADKARVPLERMMNYR